MLSLTTYTLLLSIIPIVVYIFLTFWSKTYIHLPVLISSFRTDWLRGRSWVLRRGDLGFSLCQCVVCRVCKGKGGGKENVFGFQWGLLSKVENVKLRFFFIKASEGSPYILERLSCLQIEKNKRTCRQIPTCVRVMTNKILECSSNNY